MKAEVQLCRF